MSFVWSELALQGPLFLRHEYVYFLVTCITLFGPRVTLQSSKRLLFLFLSMIDRSVDNFVSTLLFEI